MMDFPSREHQGDQQAGRVLELLEEKWFSSNTGDGSSSSRPHYDDDGGGRTSGVRMRRVYTVDTPEQHAMRSSIFSSRDRESTSRAEEDSSSPGYGKVLPSLSGHVVYRMDASSTVSGDDEEGGESPVNNHHHVKTGRVSVASMVSHACAAIYLVVFVAEVCVDMAACLLDLVRIKRS
ncbi:hypothetical protein PSENEW3n2_00000647 [Picochlorum sp. SENEW3]|nr:hypothetical protein PSENEW3n2_00000647 [Picochlorum sp. SENEW3]WPT15568.1 hypothetical protein PSENEW3_00000647 [Picochlorum sp. SENEW3]